MSLDGKPGLGQHLFTELAGRLPVIDVAKTQFDGAPAVEVLRGQSKSPLFITAIGIDAEEAAKCVNPMQRTVPAGTLLVVRESARCRVGH